MFESPNLNADAAPATRTTAPPAAPLLPDAIQRLILAGEIQALERRARAADERLAVLADLQECVQADLPAEVHPYIDWNAGTLTIDQTEHVVSIIIPGLCEVRGLWRRAVDGHLWSEATWKAEPPGCNSTLWVVVPDLLASRDTWEFAPNLPLALYIASRRAAENATAFDTYRRFRLDRVPGVLNGSVPQHLPQQPPHSPRLENPQADECRQDADARPWTPTVGQAVTLFAGLHAQRTYLKHMLEVMVRMGNLLEFFARRHQGGCEPQAQPRQNQSPGDQDEAA